MQTKELVQYIKKQEKALSAVRAAQKENKQARDENVAKYREGSRFVAGDIFSELVKETKRLDTIYKDLREKEAVYGLRIRLAVNSVVALVCNDIRDEIKEGGRLCGVSSHYKKFAAVVAEKVQEAGLDGLNAYLDLSFYNSVDLKWNYRNLRDNSSWLCNKGLNGIAELPELVDGNRAYKVYEAAEINKVVADYIRDEKACYKLVAALEKKGKEISGKYSYVKRTGIGQTDVLIYGRDYGERA